MSIILNPSQRAKILLMCVLIGLLSLVTTLVYLTGGVQYAYPHMMYLPIVLGGILFGIKGGIITGLLGGLLLGPLMPVSVESGQMQEFINWLTRLLFFTLIGTSTGFLVEKLKNYFTDRIEALRHITGTHIPLFNQFYEIAKAKEDQPLNNYGYIYINIVNYNKLSDYLGQSSYFDILRLAYDALVRIKPKDSLLYSCDAQSFVLVLPDHREINTTIDVIEHTLYDAFKINESTIHLETVIGASRYDHSIDQTLQQSIKAARYAERHFYQSAVYNEFLDEQNLDMVYLGAVVDALKNDDFYLVYQPQYNTKTKKIIGLEALLRWNHKTKGEVAPNDFIPIIEQTSLINPLTDWVVKRVLKTVKHLESQGINIPIAINISTKNLFYKGFFESLVDNLESQNITSKQIELEITESALMHNLNITENVLKKFRDYGISISLDDFGTGYSSLAYLKKFDVQKLKIDRAFISGLSTDTYSQTIIKTAVQLAQAYNITTVAEGVETQAQYDILNDLGCTYIQGYLLSHPMDIDNIIPLLNAN